MVGIFLVAALGMALMVPGVRHAFEGSGRSHGEVPAATQPAPPPPRPQDIEQIHGVGRNYKRMSGATLGTLRQAARSEPASDGIAPADGQEPIAAAAAVPFDGNTIPKNTAKDCAQAPAASASAQAADDAPGLDEPAYTPVPPPPPVVPSPISAPAVLTLASFNSRGTLIDEPPPSTLGAIDEEEGDDNEDGDDVEDNDPGVAVGNIATEIGLPVDQAYMRRLSYCRSYGALPQGPRRDTHRDDCPRNHIHRGTDLPAPAGANAMAVLDGAITEVGLVRGGGYRVTLQSNDGIEWVYRHLNRYTMETFLSDAERADIGRSGAAHVNIRVTRGQVIGHIASSHGTVRSVQALANGSYRITARGNDGYTTIIYRRRNIPAVGRRVKLLSQITGPHLHLERLQNGEYTDPTPLLFPPEIMLALAAE